MRSGPSTPRTGWQGPAGYRANRSSLEASAYQPTLVRIVVEGQHAQHAGMRESTLCEL